MLDTFFASLAEWEIREIARFASGEYTAPNFGRDLAPIAGHFAHVSLEDGGASISYTQSPDKGARDIQTRTRPGKYLAKNYPDLTAPEVSDLAATFGANHAPETFKLATSPADIRQAYSVGPNSCMAGESAVSVYGAGDLAIAYLGDLSGSVSARAICWPEKLIFGRTYGDSIRLQSALEAKGYSHAESGESWYGARLIREEISDYTFACPYLDIAYAVEDSGEFLTISARGMDARNTSGMCGEAPYTCAGCGEGLDSNSVYTSGCSDHTYCETCYGERFSYCESCENSAPADDFQRINVGVRGGREEKYVCDSCASDTAVCRDCDSGSDRFENDYTSEIAGETYCERCAENHYQCEECDDSADDGRSVGDRMLCSDCAIVAENVKTCAQCGEGFQPAREHILHCADCGAGEIMLAPGAIARPIAPAPASRWPEVATIAPDGAPDCKYRRGDLFATMLEDGRHILGFVTSTDRSGFARSVAAFGFGAYCAPFGRRPRGVGSPLRKLDSIDAARALRAQSGAIHADLDSVRAIVRPCLL